MRVPLLVMIMFASACTLSRLNWRNVDARADQMTLRSLSTGDVIGFIESEGTVAWLGIPYAEPPVGPLRWKAPLPAKKRDVFVFSATKYGPECPQAASDGGVDGDEACLTLNISARSLNEEKQPVMVWLHGGGNTSGTANEYGVMRNLSRRYGVVVVGVNYRLGVLGWFHHPALLSALDSTDDASGNYGTLDQIAALEWVRDNIAKFGGDPSNVTVFGAEGDDVAALVASPRAQGLFHRAVVERVRGQGNSFAEALEFTEAGGAPNSSSEVLLQQLLLDQRAADRDAAKALLSTLRESDVANYLRSRSPQQLLTPLGRSSSPQLLRDGHVLPASAVPASVPVLLARPRDDASPMGVQTFPFRFEWSEREDTDVGFVLGDEACELDPSACTEENEAARIKLSRAMMSYWVQFARTGAPGRGVEERLPEWKPGATMLFDSDARGGVRLEP